MNIKKSLAILISIFPGAGLVLLGKLRAGFVVWMVFISWMAIQHGSDILGTYLGLKVWLYGFITIYIFSLVLVFFSIENKNSSYLRWVSILLIILSFIIAFVDFKYYGKYTYSIVQSESNVPSLLPGDVLMQKYIQENIMLKKGDLIGFYVLLKSGQSVLFRKRIVGTSGDRIQVCGRNNVFVNGVMRRANENWKPIKLDSDVNCESLIIPDNSLYMLGDNVTNSRDSRHFGPIDMSKVHSRSLYVIGNLNLNERRTHTLGGFDN